MLKIKAIKWSMLILLLGIIVTGYGGCGKKKHKTGSSVIPPALTTAQGTATLISSGETVNAVETNFYYTSDAEQQQITTTINSLSTAGKTELIKALSNGQIVFDGASYCVIEYQSADPGYGVITITMQKVGDKWVITGF